MVIGVEFLVLRLELGSIQGQELPNIDGKS
jgi:hypothetical protein